MNMASILMAPTMETQIFSWRGSTSTTMRQLVESMFHELYLLIWNLVPWILFVLGHLVKSSVKCLNVVLYAAALNIIKNPFFFAHQSLSF